MLFWVKNGPLATPLVTTTTPAGLLLPTGGGLGVPGTTVLYNSTQDYGALSGGRLTVGGWLDDRDTIGLNARGFLLQQGTQRATFLSNGSATSPPLFVPVNILAVPTVPAAFVGQNGIPIALPFTPGVTLGGAGSISIVSQSQLWGAEANGLVNLFRNGGLTVNALAGFRYVDLDENLTLSTTTNSFNVPGNVLFFPSTGAGPGPTAPPASSATGNNFYAAKVGVKRNAPLVGFLLA